MNPRLEKNQVPGAPFRFAVPLAYALIVLAGLAAYRTSYSGAFFFDDTLAIEKNRTIRHVWAALSPGPDTTASGRPLVNLSLAVNYALGGLNPIGYHVLNVLIHLLAGLTLFGIVRRSLLQPGLRERFGKDALPLALAVAALWTVHPLQTESVTYVVQRAESMMGLFYLLTLYAFIRGAEAGSLASSGGIVTTTSRGSGWLLLSVAACFLGMATKEVMVSAPVLTLFYDRTFVASSFREAWNRRRVFYAALACAWIPLAFLVLSTGGNRGGTIGFGIGVAWWAYGLTQFGAIVRYLCLSVWPHPLVFDYGTYWVKDIWTVLPDAFFVGALALLTLAGLWRRTAAGFLGCWFFAILAPTSLMPGTTQMTVEHRMYLPLAAVLALLVLGAYRLGGRRSWVLFAAACAAFVFLTARRNATYCSALSIWQDTLARRPDNASAHDGLGFALEQAGRPQQAEAELREAIRLRPTFGNGYGYLGAALIKMGRLPEAIEAFEQASRLSPGRADTRYNLGVVLVKAHRLSEAVDEFREAIRLQPKYPEAFNNLGVALNTLGRKAEALAAFERAVDLNADYSEARYNLGSVLSDDGRFGEAVRQYREILRLYPEDAALLNLLANTEVQSGELSAAEAHYREALRIRPSLLEAHVNLAHFLAHAGRLVEAIPEYQAVLGLDPKFPQAREELERARGLLARQGPRE